mgnify:CR=1 FL=1
MQGGGEGREGENITENLSTSLSQEEPFQMTKISARDSDAFEEARNWDEFLLIKAAENNCKFTRFLDRHNLLTEKERDEQTKMQLEKYIVFQKKASQQTGKRKRKSAI